MFGVGVAIHAPQYAIGSTTATDPINFSNFDTAPSSILLDHAVAT